MAFAGTRATAISLTGAQVELSPSRTQPRSDSAYIKPRQIEQHLNDGKVNVVAGFRGTHELEITTLGRGGSDTSAVAITAALKASYLRKSTLMYLGF